MGKDEAKERRSALTHETEEIDDLINRRKHKIRALQFEIDNPGMRAPMTDSFDELMKRLDRYESLADIERMIATQQRIINEKKLELGTTASDRTAPHRTGGPEVAVRTV